MFIATVLCLQTVEAQRLYSEVGDIYEKSKRTVVDNAKLGAFYKLKFRTDSTKLNDYTEAVEFYNSGLEPEDFEMLDKHRIEYDRNHVRTIRY